MNEEDDAARNGDDDVWDKKEDKVMVTWLEAARLIKLRWKGLCVMEFAGPIRTKKIDELYLWRIKDEWWHCIVVW